ncbi:MAG TPA: RdgB/HAM1 family non-canonical purine NTP pyrophosphatase [Acidimicrobiia bacterium]|nr:RdgB/HAM1 family non-canonical purine NTP pyrophosphatase [Acidimicrobiia bacterium]
MSIPRLVLATKNQGKHAEMSDIVLGMGLAEEIVTGLDWADVDETGTTLEENALLKGRAVTEATGLPALADDTGLSVKALQGQPGVHSARYAGPTASYADNYTKLLGELEGAEDRSARFVTVVALVLPDGSFVTAEGTVEGEIALEPRGEGGFGYDPVFMVGGRTMSQMGVEEKNRISHRKRALAALGEALGL